MRPALRYHGGKWRLAPWIIQHFPPHRVYVEPYGGAASVLLRKPRSYAEVYNDVWDEVVNLFRVLRDDALAADLAKALHLTPFSRTEFRQAQLRCDDPTERARRLVIRSFQGHGSMATVEGNSTGFRCDTMRSRTHPCADWRNYPPNVWLLTDRLRGVVIENMTALETISRYDYPETLLFVDPPYPSDTRGSTSKYEHEMTDDDHRALAACLHQVKGMVVLCGYPCDLYDCELYKRWWRTDRQALADKGAKRTEVLWLNAAAARSQQGRLELDDS